MNCPSCGLQLPPSTASTGRPATYCSPECRKAAEHTLRRLNRRLESYELELREAQAGRDRWGYWYEAEEERLDRIRVLKQWIKTDEARLRALLGGAPVGKTKPKPAADALQTVGDQP